MFEIITLRTKPCPMCQKVHQIDVLKEDYEKYRAGAFVQVAFPEMLPEMRELLISGTCPQCFAILFPPEVPQREEG